MTKGATRDNRINIFWGLLQ